MDIDPWELDLLVVRGGAYTGTERRSISHDVERGLVAAVRPGVYTERTALDSLGPEQRHVVAARALAAARSSAVVFSHWTAAVLLGLPSDRRALTAVHVTVTDAGRRSGTGIAAHVAPLATPEVQRVGELWVTTAPRTAVDVAMAGTFRQGVVVADGALYRGLPRLALEDALARAEGRKGAVRAADTVAFAHPGRESANESESGVSMFQLRLEPQVLQHEVWDEFGLAGVLDTYSPRYRVGGEADGAAKLLDPRLATAGAGVALYREKRREDRVRAQLAGLARWGYAEACNPNRLRPVLNRAGLRPPRSAPTLADWAAAARTAHPRLRR